jgi:protein gp37
MAQSTIEWTEVTWNPTTGCNKISAGCKYCYAEAFSKRLKAMGLDKYQNGFELALHEHELDKPYQWTNPKIVFVNSMSDLFHEKIPLSFIQRVFEVMNDCPQHIFQILTKRADTLLRYDPYLNWTDNIWMGVSVENQKVIERVDLLRAANAKIKFLSCEPLLESLSSLKFSGIDWVIVGGESGKKCRPMNPEWVIEIRDKCKSLNIPFFFKQWGGTNKKKTGRKLEGIIYNEMPSINPVS